MRLHVSNLIEQIRFSYIVGGEWILFLRKTKSILIRFFHTHIHHDSRLYQHIRIKWIERKYLNFIHANVLNGILDENCGNFECYGH